jgi:glycosyltransferase involved in cell wall biosynthesis
MKHRGLLYLSYDGILEPLGQSQVLAYLEHLAEDRLIHLVSFEKRESEKNLVTMSLVSSRVDKAGIQWHRLRYHKRPSSLATAYDIAIGTILGIWLTLRHRLGVVHARSYVPSVMALAIKSFCGVRFIFDMRGFWADERVDGGIWPKGSKLYVAAKWFERHFILASDHVVSLTRAGIEEIQTFKYLRGRALNFSVIPTCADLDRFTPSSAGESTQGDSVFTLGYVGAAGTWYMFEPLVECFRQLLLIRPNSKLLILNHGEHVFIQGELDRALIPAHSIELIAAEYSEVPRYMARMNAAAFFIRPVYSKKASAPTKLGELLGCGIPCLTNTGVGDSAEILEGCRVGVALSAFDTTSLQGGLARLLELCADSELARRCREAALVHFSLKQAVASYRAIYERLDREGAAFP